MNDAAPPLEGPHRAWIDRLAALRPTCAEDTLEALTLVARLRAADAPIPSLEREALVSWLRRGLGLDGLAGDAAQLVDLFDDVDAGRLEVEDGAELVQSALEARDRAEWAKLGAEALGELLAEADQIGIEAFDLVIADELARLTQWNAVRHRGLRALPRAVWPRFGWRSRGIEVDPGAWASLASVAELTVLSAKAAQRFAQLRAMLTR